MLGLSTNLPKAESIWRKGQEPTLALDDLSSEAWEESDRLIESRTLAEFRVRTCSVYDCGGLKQEGQHAYDSLVSEDEESQWATNDEALSCRWYGEEAVASEKGETRNQMTSHEAEQAADEFIASAKMSNDKQLVSEFRKLAIEFVDDISGDFEGGAIELPACEIELMNTETQQDPKAWSQRQRPMAPALRRAVKTLIEKGERAGVMERVEDIEQVLLVVNLLGVPKPDGEVRVCFDGRPLNRRVRKLIQNLPNLRDCIDALKGSELISVFDARHGFWQVAVSEESRNLLCFWTPDGIYRWRVLPMGYVNSSVIFQQAMEKMMGPIITKYPGSGVYIDDLRVATASKGEEGRNEHLAALRLLFERCRQYKVQLKATKSQIGLRGVISGLFGQRRERTRWAGKGRRSAGHTSRAHANGPVVSGSVGLYRTIHPGLQTDC